MKQIGITGNIGCGKSTVASLLTQEEGCALIDADKEAHHLYESHPHLVEELTAEFGPQILGPQGELLRPVLGKIVFSDPKHLQKLNNIVHPALAKHLQDLRLRLAQENDFVFLDGALIIEWNTHKSLDHLVLVDTPEDLRFTRVVQRGLSPEEARKRMNLQMPVKEKMLHADTVIDNRGNLDQLKTLVEAFKNDLKTQTPRPFYTFFKKK